MARFARLQLPLIPTSSSGLGRIAPLAFTVKTSNAGDARLRFQSGSRSVRLAPKNWLSLMSFEEQPPRQASTDSGTSEHQSKN